MNERSRSNPVAASALRPLGGNGHRVVVLQPSYLPWRGYFHQMWLADTFVFLDDVQYDKHSWRNRNRLKGSGGSFWITVPVRIPAWPPPPILGVEIDNASPWRRKHRDSIHQSYARAPEAPHYLPLIDELYSREWTHLVDLDITTTTELARLLGIRTRCIRSSELNAPGTRTERLVNLCRALGATRYLSGPSARDYLDESRFADAGVEVEWMDYAYPPHPQLHGDFDPFVSVVDLLMNCGSKAPEFIWDTAHA